MNNSIIFFGFLLASVACGSFYGYMLEMIRHRDGRTPWYQEPYLGYILWAFSGAIFALYAKSTTPFASNDAATAYGICGISMMCFAASAYLAHQWLHYVHARLVTRIAVKVMKELGLK
jgi:hypothetical protein